MKLPPIARLMGREAIVVLGGALLAAALIGRMPAVRDWIKRQWGDTPRP